MGSEAPWIEWAGGECPVEGSTIVIPKYRAQEDPGKGVRMAMAPAWRLAWYHDGEDDDIIAYRLAHPTPGDSPCK